ncbi:nucleoid-associated protein [Pseudomaricurvus alkylphenolicus]|uniref:nucleoid-associated protein n=1 Tax=Pseudomaricurvus alkylphenolicus TaxID=1306991 RepID=UPI001421C2B0|nr:nucleoid-associated protein [Pseudomaricurvus alkylphenolicus]NIB44446.1 nucleoid-associated protein [Pseudomaricurvus alkylphenolicus]
MSEDDTTATLSVLHHLNLTADSVGSPIPIESDSDFESYIAKLMEDFYDPRRFKSYHFASETTEVATALKGVTAANWSQRAQIVAERLHRVEIATQKSVSQLVELRSGSLVQIYTQINGQQAIIITKVDHSEFLDESELKSRLGLPFRQRIQKSMVALFEDETTIAEIRVSDTNAKISVYWWKDFLELEELKTSEKNTQTSFAAIDKTLRAQLHKKNKKSDFWALRNAVIGYFQTQQSFAFDMFVDTVFSQYQPDDPSIDVQKLIKDIKQLPDRHKFDTQFTIAHHEIKAKIKDTIKLSSNLELKITGDIPDMKNVILAKRSADGRKYIQIFSERGYDEFAKMESEPS